MARKGPRTWIQVPGTPDDDSLSEPHPTDRPHQLLIFAVLHQPHLHIPPLVPQQNRNLAYHDSSPNRPSLPKYQWPELLLGISRTVVTAKPAMCATSCENSGEAFPVRLLRLMEAWSPSSDLSAMPRGYVCSWVRLRFFNDAQRTSDFFAHVPHHHHLVHYSTYRVVRTRFARSFFRYWVLITSFQTPSFSRSSFYLE